MKDNEKINVKLLSGLNIVMTDKVYESSYRQFDELQYFSFNNFLNAGAYFPQILQFITIMYFILNGHISFKEIMICNLISGVGYTLIWYIFKLYKIPGLSFISCLLGGNIFRFFFHFIIIIIVSLFYIKKWEIILFCIISGLIVTLLKNILIVVLGNSKYNDEIANYVSKFKK